MFDQFFIMGLHIAKTKIKDAKSSSPPRPFCSNQQVLSKQIISVHNLIVVLLPLFIYLFICLFVCLHHTGLIWILRLIRDNDYCSSEFISLASFCVASFRIRMICDFLSNRNLWRPMFLYRLRSNSQKSHEECHGWVGRVESEYTCTLFFNDWFEVVEPVRPTVLDRSKYTFSKSL